MRADQDHILGSFAIKVAFFYIIVNVHHIQRSFF